MFLLAADDPVSHVTDLILVGTKEFPIITMHMVTLVIAGLLTWWMISKAARAIVTGPESEGNERYITKGKLAQMIEVMTVYLRNQMIVPVLGEQATRRYLPFLMTVFYFILFNNLLGMIPLVDLQHVLHVDAIFGGRTIIGGTPTGNIIVTGTLAIFSLFVIQVHAFRELGVKGWLVHHCGGLYPGPIYLAPIVALVFVVEVLGDFIKPMALMIRLFANMLAGHVLLAVIIGFGKMAADAKLSTAGVAGITVLSGVFALAISFLELFVAFLQAFIFMFLTAVFISLMSHHEEHDHADEAGHEEHESEHGRVAPAHA